MFCASAGRIVTHPRLPWDYSLEGLCGSLWDRRHLKVSDDQTGNTGDDLPDRQCWVRQEDQSDLPPGSLLGTSATRFQNLDLASTSGDEMPESFFT